MGTISTLVQSEKSAGSVLVNISPNIAKLTKGKKISSAQIVMKITPRVLTDAENG
jgi:hypothetical protein